MTYPAPSAVYQTYRTGYYASGFTYTFPNLKPGSAYVVRLHFADGLYQSIGQRVFNVTINGNQVLDNFDIIGAAGAPSTAVVEQFNTDADQSGNVTVTFTNVTAAAIVSGIEVLTGTAVVSGPTNLLAVGGNAKVTLTWSRAYEATKYHVLRSTSATGPFTAVATAQL